ncbi:MAG: phenylalanine 4-monooxygenase [Pseudomonadota bacterium]
MGGYASRDPDAKGIYPYSDAENAVWRDLFTRQVAALRPTACRAYLDGLEKLAITAEAVPQVSDVDARLSQLTGAGVKGVPAIIPFDEFANLLANRKFPVATFIRRREDFDYIEEPDIFHEVFGHAPMLTDPDFCVFMERFGRLALSMDEAQNKKLVRLFWFTVEFGLIREDGALKAFGAGICSSPSEVGHALSGQAEVVPFDLETVLRTPYRIDIVQPVYFAIDSFAQLAASIDCDMVAALDAAATKGDLPARFDQAA